MYCTAQYNRTTLLNLFILVCFEAGYGLCGDFTILNIAIHSDSTLCDKNRPITIGNKTRFRLGQIKILIVFSRGDFLFLDKHFIWWNRVYGYVGIQKTGTVYMWILVKWHQTTHWTTFHTLRTDSICVASAVFWIWKEKIATHRFMYHWDLMKVFGKVENKKLLE